MTRTNVDFTFKLANGTTHKVTVKDVKDDIDETELSAIAELIIEKESQHNQSLFVSLKECRKYTIDEEIVISND